MIKWSRRNVLTAAAIGACAAVGGAASMLVGPGGNILRPGRSRARPVSTDAQPPTESEVVVIGAGLLGVSIAYELAHAGIPVTVCEKGAVAGEASGRSQGQVAGAGLEPWKLSLVNLSKDMWGSLDERVNGQTGFRRTGLVCPFVNESDEEEWKNWIERAGPAAPKAQLVDGKRANEMVPASYRWRGAFYDPTDGAAEPTLAAPAIAEGAMKLGAKVVAPCAVRGFETQGGRISHVVTEKGAIRTSTVVLAGGCWASSFAERAKLKLPSLNIFTTQLHIGRFNGPEYVASLPEIDFRRQTDGGYTLGATRGVIAITPELLRNLWDFRHVLMDPPWDVHPNLSRYFWEELGESRTWRLDQTSPYEHVRVLEPAVNTKLRQQLLDAATRALPESKNAAVLETWSGALNVTPDNVPVISAVGSIPGFFLATGFSYGLTMAPAAGLLMSQLITGQTPTVDLHPYRYERFVDGSRLELTH